MKRALAAALVALAGVAAVGLARRGPAKVAPGPAPAAASPTSAAPTPPRLQALDLAGNAHAIGGVTSARATALVFLATECPISNRALPMLSAIAKARAAQGVVVYGVISDPGTTRAAAIEHAKKFAVDFPVLFDATGELASVYRPVATPEAFVLAADGRVAYRGRIDDSFEAVGKPRQVVAHHELDDALDAVARSAPVATPSTSPVGCWFEAWGRDFALPTSITYARDVAPILDAHCVDCHHAGGIAPFALTTLAQASKRAHTLADVTETRQMPPWHAEPGYGRFLGERRLTDREIATLAAWAKAGAPGGDPADQPPLRTFASGWQLGEPDLVVSMPRAFEVPAAGPDIYRAFVLKADIPEDRIVVATELRPGAPSVVHHVLTYVDISGAARVLEERAGGNGYPSFGSAGFVPAGSLGGWVPGTTPRFLPEGLGRPLPRGSDIVIQVHYHPSGKVERDRSSIALYFARRPVARVVASLSIWNRDIDIPAGEPRYRRTIDQVLPMGVTVVGITPHMHLVGREMKVTATLPSGAVLPLVWVRNWDFRWQDQYFYESPLELPAGTRIHVDALYDNSAENPNNPSNPPQRILFGEQTTEEMCLCFLAIAVTTPDDLRKLATAVAPPRR